MSAAAATESPFKAVLAELVSMTDPAVRKATALKILKRKYTPDPVWCGFNWFEMPFKKAGGCLGCNHIYCVFGEFSDPRATWESASYTVKPYNYGSAHARCGVEILGAQPNATGHTYSRKCLITVPKLKAACKANCIRTTGLDKRGLLAALMKV